MISENTSESEGAGVDLDSGTFTMNGGTISKNTATNSHGGGVNVDSGTYTMNGGTISENTADSSGSGVYIDSGTFIMNSGTISKNTADSNGGGVYIDDGENFYMNGGMISNNTAADRGGGIFIDSYSDPYDIYDGYLYMTGGSITGNTAGTHGGGIYARGGSFIPSGTAVVTDNIVSDGTTSRTENVYLPSGKTITLGGELKSGASIGVTTEDKPTTSTAVQITAAETETAYYNTASSCFFSDNTAYGVRANTTGKYLELSPAITGSVSINGDAIYGKTLTAALNADVPTGATYQWMRGTAAISGATDSTYILTAADVGETITVVVSHINYVGTLSASTFGDVQKAAVTASISGTTTKIYDGTTDVTDTSGLSITLSGVMEADRDYVSASAESYAYTDADAGETKTITASNVALSGSAAGNYVLSGTSVSANAGSITARALNEDDFSVNTDTETYTGSAITKAITSLNGLTEGTDYSLSYSNNVNAGTAAITITGIGNYSGQLDYTFIIAAAEQSISYSKDNVTKHINDAAFINALTQTIGDGTITYTSSNPDVVIADTASGEVTIVGAGTATITATAAATDNYNEATASYTLTVTDHSYIAAVVAPTYTEQGYTLYTCTHCDDSYKTDDTAIRVIDGTDENLSTKTTVQELTTVPDGLKNLYSSVDELISDLISRVVAVGTGYTEDNTLVYDVVLQYSTDGGTTWITATVDNFPTNGITVTLPYPEGTDASYEFTVLHMFTETSSRLGITAGGTETPIITKTDDGLVVTLTGLSPVAIAWKAVTTSTTETETINTSGTSASSTVSSQTGDNSPVALWFVLLSMSGAGVIGAVAYNRKRKYCR